ncbi:MAG: carbohydrate ABC transporter permease [candidate division KSB1 bacterium]|nr:carbohydrate ABC transporter permease [candidate division KSB1 bacterium]MDZ7312329.1 carbohydrate ABC transporter permease [candidate division KSB1 bacterium]
MNGFGRFLKHAALTLGALMVLTPLIWLFISSLKTTPEIIARPPVWLPRIPQWSNYLRVFSEIPMLTYYLNSLMVAGAVSLIVLFTSSLAGYALSKFKFPGRDFIFKGILATMMIPSVLFIIPMYYLMLRVPFAGGNDIFGMGGSGFLHSHISLIFPFVVSAWGIFLLRQFFMTIPDDLLYAARIDGCSEFRIYWEVALPHAKPALATLAIFTFVGQWNSFLWPLVITTSAPELTTVPVGLQMLQVAFNPSINLHLIMAGILVGIVPAVVLFLILQRYYVQGITLTGLKE